MVVLAFQIVADIVVELLWALGGLVEPSKTVAKKVWAVFEAFVEFSVKPIAIVVRVSVVSPYRQKAWFDLGKDCFELVSKPA